MNGDVGHREVQIPALKSLTEPSAPPDSAQRTRLFVLCEALFLLLSSFLNLTIFF